jgi:hypothetical protein
LGYQPHQVSLLNLCFEDHQTLMVVVVVVGVVMTKIVFE